MKKLHSHRVMAKSGGMKLTIHMCSIKFLKNLRECTESKYTTSELQSSIATMSSSLTQIVIWTAHSVIKIL